ncbi:uncharacterized protein [Apteryx mantelli]|uniref:Uncharacterized protein n=1 Tax=Apteryx mantelli TaxID=2696672 RepID=A0ABM4FA11_9AVES
MSSGQPSHKHSGWICQVPGTSYKYLLLHFEKQRSLETGDACLASGWRYCILKPVADCMLSSRKSKQIQWKSVVPCKTSCLFLVLVCSWQICVVYEGQLGSVSSFLL